MNNLKKKIFVASFLIIIFACPILFLIPGNQKNTENRMLTEMPVLNLENWKQFPLQFENYFNDHVPFKSLMTRIYSTFCVKVLNTSTQDSVILGENDFYFYNSIYKGDYNTMADFSGRELYTDDELKQILEKLKLWSKEAKETGKEFVLFIGPNKSSIYEEEMPAYVREFSNYSRTDQLVEYLRENSTLRIIYPKKELLEMKDKYLLYYKKDTHWNDLGAFVGVQEFNKEIKGEQAISLDECLIGEEIIRESMPEKIVNLDLANMLGIRGSVTDYNYEIYGYKEEMKYIEEIDDMGKGITYMLNPNNSPRILMYFDSFSYGMRPFLAREYEKVYYIPHAEMSTDDFKNYDVDYIVFECVERTLRKLLEQ